MPGKTRKTVLIVDDERDLVEPLALRLRADGRCDVAMAFDGDDGLRKARSLLPDTVLLDLSMPGIDGWELCRLLRQGAKPPRLVVMTAWVSKDLQKRARSEGVERVLLKPFEESELLEAVLGDAPAEHADTGGPKP